MSELNALTIADARDKLRVGEVTSVELTEACLKAADEAKALNAVVHSTPEIALEQAKAADARISAGDAPDMCGIPLGIKDLFCTKGVPSQAASGILEGFKPEYESTVTTQLFDAGAVMIGKLNMDEFAMGSSNETSAFGPVINPWRKGEDLVPGGSSGGSAAAVAADMCLGATATDTGGSIRQPASFTGTVGIKPTYGRCSRWGTVAFASSLDQAGPIAKTVKDAAILLESMAGYDPKDSTSLNIGVPKWSGACGQSIKGLRIGIPKEYSIDGMPEEIQALWDQGIEWMKAAGAEIAPITLPHTNYALPADYVVAPAEASSNLARYDGMRYGHRSTEANGFAETYTKSRSEGFGTEVQRRILLGTFVLSSGYYDAYYGKAQKVRRLIKDQQPRVGHQRPADGQHLLFTTTERSAILLDPLR